jgi:hypothetical protein
MMKVPNRIYKYEYYPSFRVYDTRSVNRCLPSPLGKPGDGGDLACAYSVYSLRPGSKSSTDAIILFRIAWDVISH